MTAQAGEPRARPDARAERWRQHRVQVREDFVDAAFRALDSVGPDASMADIAREAGAAKPKLYRFFHDKADLYEAVLGRLQDLLFTRIMGSIDLVQDTGREVVRHGATEYAHVVAEYPNAFRFLSQSRFVRAGAEAEHALESMRNGARRAADVLSSVLEENGVTYDSVELSTLSVGGAVMSATDWWLSSDQQQSASPMSTERFVDYITALVLGVVESFARINDVTLDPDRPIAETFVQADRVP